MNPSLGKISASIGLLLLSGLALGTETPPASRESMARPTQSAGPVPPSRPLSAHDRTVLAVVKSVIHLFKQSGDAVWPGYNLSERPFIVYIPDAWAIFLNASGAAEGFGAYPPGWPDLETKAIFHPGAYKDLSGQLAFDFEAGGVKTIAIGLPAEFPKAGAHSEASLFGFIVHEAFHQFQNDSFAEIPWEREEKYPIEDRENTALACLEMRLLQSALDASFSHRQEAVDESLKEFVAVRLARWRQGDSFIARYERGQEVREGTAQYVEAKSLQVIKSLDHPHFFDAVSFPAWIDEDFNGRLTEGSVAPDDMLRNRIYPVGCSLGFLADSLGIAWKEKAQKASQDFDFASLFKEKFGLADESLNELLDRAKTAASYADILNATDTLIKRYQEQFESERSAFEAQPGFRLELEFAYGSLSRSRSSQAKRWTMDKGRVSLCRHYEVYALKTDDLSLQVRGVGILEEDDWDKKWKKVTFFVPGISMITIDGKMVRPEDEGAPREFNTLELSGNGFTLTAKRAGMLNSSGGKLRIVLNPLKSML